MAVEQRLDICEAHAGIRRQDQFGRVIVFDLVEAGEREFGIGLARLNDGGLAAAAADRNRRFALIGAGDGVANICDIADCVGLTDCVDLGRFDHVQNRGKSGKGNWPP